MTSARNVERWECPRCGAEITGRKWCSGGGDTVDEWHPMTLGEKVEYVRADAYRGAVEALRELFEASAPYQPKVEGVNAEDDRLSAARWAAGHYLRGQ